ncbi:MAG TPA: LLM class F420-dependent oxidoreductase [Acidimicrobiales bacterium]|nr:LLM class F420-dependent oxidoreductase [Acidimicrobiales bacterium]
MSPQIDAVLPFWFDRPDNEALDIAHEVRAAGLDTLWIGEMATFDAFALATAVGLRVPELRLKIGPLAIGVRTPVSMALAAASVTALTGCQVSLALGASSPAIVSGWHGREWAHSGSRMRETVGALRPILAGERSSFEGSYVRTHGFRLRPPQPQLRISVAAFGPAMMRVAARLADEVVLNLVSPQHVSAVRAVIDLEAAAAGRNPPDLAVWVPAALDPGDRARAQISAQLAMYLAAPGYGEMFSTLGFSELVGRARSGVSRSELASSIPTELLQQICALGSDQDVTGRISEYFQAGADIVGIAPSTAEDPGGRAVLSAIATILREPPVSPPASKETQAS